MIDTELPLVAVGKTQQAKVNSLIARVYHQAALELRRFEEMANQRHQDVMHSAAEELVRLQDMAKKFS